MMGDNDVTLGKALDAAASAHKRIDALEREVKDLRTLTLAIAKVDSKVFKISKTTLTRWINKEKEGKLGEVKIQVRKPKKIYPEKLIKYIEKHPDAYLVEIAEEFNCSECAIRKALKKLNITRKKDNFIQRTM